jgi:8-oxo-dGTP pyrophosphatase MutT (NUDIX family)
MNKLKPHGNETIVFKGEIFEIVRKPFKTGNKKKIIEIARRSPGTRLIILKENKLLLSKEFRVELNDYDYRLPGGKVFNCIDVYENFLKTKKDILPLAIKAAKKECLEEVGIVAKKLKLFQTVKAGTNVEWDLFYFIVNNFKESGQKLEDGEVIYPEWKTFDEVEELCLNNKIKEDRTVGVLLKFLLSRNLKSLSS